MVSTHVCIDGISWIIEPLSRAAEVLVMDGFLEFYNTWAPLSCLIGFLLLAHARNRKTYIRRLLKYGRTAEGRVLELRQGPVSLFGANQGDGYAPVVEYRDHSGNVIRHCSTTYRIDCKHQVGDVVRVWYQVFSSTRDSTLADDQPGDLPRIFFMIGIFLLAIGLPAVIPKMLALLGFGA